MARITTTEAAIKLGRDQSRIRQLILDGRLPAEKVGRDWLIEESDLDAVRDLPRGRPPKDG